MPTIRVGVNASPTDARGQVVDIDTRAANVSLLANVGAEAISFSVDGGSNWTSVAASGTASPGLVMLDQFRVRRGLAGGYPVPIDVTFTSTSTVTYDSTSATLISADGAAVTTGGGTLRAAAWRQVATRGQLCNFVNAGAPQAMYRSTHYMRSSVKGLKLVFGNWYVDASGEVACPGTATITASIEYPANTFTQVTFSGSTSGSCGSGLTIESDEAKISIPNGAPFWIRTFWVNATGGIIYQNGTTSAIGDGSRVSGSTDQTMGGTVTAATTASYAPLAIIGYTSDPSWMIIGDSIQMGSQETGDATGDFGMLAREVGSTYPYIKCGISGDLQSLYLSSGTRRTALKVYCTHVANAYGYNDIFVGSSRADQLLANYASMLALFPGMPFYQCTITPGTTSTASFVAPADQTVRAGSSIRAAVNNAIRRGAVVGAAGIIEVADVFESAPNSGIWKGGGVLRTVTDGAITSGTAAFTSATAAFTQSDTGQLIQIAGAGAAGASLIAFMTYASATAVNLTNLTTGAAQNASTTVSGATCQIGVYPLTADGVHPWKGGYLYGSARIVMPIIR